MGTHPIFESDFDCLTEKMLSSRLVTRSSARRATFQKTPGTLMTPPRFADTMQVNNGTVMMISGTFGLGAAIIAYLEMGAAKQYIKVVDALDLKYAKLEDVDTVLRTKILAARLAAAGDDDEDDE